MPQHPFQIAQEHHRAGRLRQAEAGYRAVIASEPNDADAVHWLGVLLHQAGLSGEAVTLLERAVALRPRDAAFQHNLGMGYVAAGRADDAITALERAAALDPTRAETLAALGVCHLSRRPNPDPRAAVAALRQARDAGLDTPSLHHDLGVAQLAAGAADEAIVSLRAAAAKDPAYASAYHYLAMAHREKEEPKEVRKCLLKALEIDPDRTRSWYLLGVLDVESGNPGQAVASFRKVVRIDPNDAAAYRALGDALRDAGREGEAKQAERMAERIAGGAFAPAPAGPAAPASVAAFEERLTPTGEAAKLHFAVSAATGLLPPARLPSDELAKLFDRYADRFDAHLQNDLGYRIPGQLAEAVAAARPPGGRGMDVFDLGCGTGLCGPLLRPMAATLRGVDLSPGMVEKARARRVYDALEVGDLVDALNRHRRAFDLLAAADVLNYVGDLAPVMEAAAAALRPGGLFAFSVEAGGGDRFHLQQPVRRFAHSRPYLDHVASIFGFEQRSLSPVTIRLERGEPVPGFLAVFAVPADVA